MCVVVQSIPRTGVQPVTPAPNPGNSIVDAFSAPLNNRQDINIKRRHKLGKQRHTPRVKGKQKDGSCFAYTHNCAREPGAQHIYRVPVRMCSHVVETQNAPGTQSPGSDVWLLAICIDLRTQTEFSQNAHRNARKTPPVCRIYARLSASIIKSSRILDHHYSIWTPPPPSGPQLEQHAIRYLSLHPEPRDD